MPLEPLPPRFDRTDLPAGLPADVYASWMAIRKELLKSPDMACGERRFEFCSGYVQELVDGRVIDDRCGSFMKTQLREIWIEILGHFPNGNPSAPRTDEDDAWLNLSDVGLERFS
ncbi:hypothetical protein [Pseudomonas coleopterorum]|uniref:hypothetical protein n=1 Tax=Pseudomonas coleopterorum TaxID=1605838 RepID=UPI00178636A9|nr:hypothetical protein [Pseudomonas coleopterorum]MBD8481388.1 hypothetical protein [Pseudomonas coleopterorum]